MKTLQMYETTIMAEKSDHAAHLIVLPSRSLGPMLSLPIEDILRDLGLSEIIKVNASNLSHALAVLLSGAVPTDEVNKQLFLAIEGQIEKRAGATMVAASDMSFAEVVAFDDIVPIEQSPLNAEALVTLVTKASGAGLGAFAGFVAFGASPLLLITVPAGMIVCGAAKGIADALENGLRDRLLDLLKKKPRKHTDVESSQPSAAEDAPKKPARR
jgi:hypothetical protein